MVHHQATGPSKAVSNDNFQPSLFPQTCSILICRAKKSQSLVLLCLWHLKRQSNCFFSTPRSSASQNAGGRTDCTGCAWVQRGIISSLYQHLKINRCKEGAVGSMSSVQWPVLYLWSHYGMATQITYSLIYTTHKLFPFIVATLFTRDQTQCATNSPGDQSPLWGSSNISLFPPSPKPIHLAFRTALSREGVQLSLQLIQSLTLRQYGHQLQVLLRIYLIVQRKAQISKLLA